MAMVLSCVLKFRTGGGGDMNASWNDKVEQDKWTSPHGQIHNSIGSITILAVQPHIGLAAPALFQHAWI